MQFLRITRFLMMENKSLFHQFSVFKAVADEPLVFIDRAPHIFKPFRELINFLVIRQIFKGNQRVVLFKNRPLAKDRLLKREINNLDRQKENDDRD